MRYASRPGDRHPSLGLGISRSPNLCYLFGLKKNSTQIYQIKQIKGIKKGSLWLETTDTPLLFSVLSLLFSVFNDRTLMIQIELICADKSIDG